VDKNNIYIFIYIKGISLNKSRDAVGIESRENGTKEFLENVNKMRRVISDHFQEEINLTKEITQKEKATSSKKVELKEIQIRLVKFPTKVELNDKINLLSKEIETNYKKIEEIQILQDNYIKKRSEIKKMIGTQNNEYLCKFLSDYFEYFSLKLTNLNLESKKFAYSAELKIKDLQLDALMNIIREKDLHIIKKNLKGELVLNSNKANNNNYNNPDFSLQVKTTDLDIELINGLKGKKSVNKSEIIKGQIDDVLIDGTDSKNNKLNKKNNIGNFNIGIGKKNIDVLKNEDSNNNFNSINNEGKKISNPYSYLRRVDFTKNVHNKNFSEIKKTCDAKFSLRSKSPESIKKSIKNNSNNKGIEVLLKKKSITDKGNLKGIVNANHIKN